MNRIIRFQSFVILSVLLSLQVHSQDLRVADSLSALVSRTADPGTKADLLMHISTEYEFLDSRKALTFALQAVDHAMAASDEYRHANALLQAAKVYYLLSDLNNAMDFSIRARDIAESNGYVNLLARALDAIGIMYYEIGDHGKSSDYFFASLRIYEKIKDKEGIGQLYCQIGTLYHKQKDNAKAVDYYQRSIDIARELNDREGISANLHNIAMVYSSETKPDQALPLFFEALAINKTSGDTRLIGSNYLNISDLYLNLGQLDSAMVYINYAIDIFDKLGNKVRIAQARVKQGQIYLAMGEYDEGLTSANEALEISRLNGFKESISEAAGLLHRIYLAKKDTVRAYTYSILQHDWRDSLALGENKKTLARLELQYQFDKKEQQLRLEKQRRNFFIIILGIITLFSILVTILLWSWYRLREKKAILEKKSLELDLDYKKKELTANVMSLMKKNEMLSEITKKIIRIKKESEHDETKSALKKVINELQKSTDDEILKEFSLRFKEVHKDFYDHLLLKYPGLTPSELKLCAFLRLNMTTKEIAELTGQQINTLENARYRLRQKLGITSSDISLVTFLSQV